ncbi:alpha/beta fold hydrolase [Spongiibacter tropicus]|uniref:alpha/beta fold hydrolase n=1 Tax=Spongiibacter tropicus TaxID=454602 RepID=UPI003A98FF42
MSTVFETLRFWVDDIELVARVSGPEDGIPVMALHGWLDNALSFEAIAERQNTWRLVALDLPGHGHSGHKPASGSYGIWEDLRSILGVADQLGWPRFVVLAHSRGAMMAALLAAAQPDRVAALVCIDGLLTRPVAEEDFPVQLGRYLHDFEKPGRPARAFNSLEEAAKARIKAMPMSVPAALRIVERGTQQGEDGKYRWRSDRRVGLASSIKLTHGQWLAVMKAIRAPLLFVSAQQGFGEQLLGLLAEDERPVDFQVLAVEGDHHCHMGESAAAISDAAQRHFAEAWSKG